MCQGLNKDRFTKQDRLKIIGILRIYCTILNTFVQPQEVQQIFQLLATIDLDIEFLFFLFFQFIWDYF